VSTVSTVRFVNAGFSWLPWMLDSLRWTRGVERRALILGRPVKWICRAESISVNNR
jgi:hypothetical protein